MTKKPKKKNAAPKKPKCPVYKTPCRVHDFTHGAEAEELRQGIEALLDLQGFDPDDEFYNSPSAFADKFRDLRDGLQRLMEKVDARDSLAFLEAKDRKR